MAEYIDIKDIAKHQKDEEMKLQRKRDKALSRKQKEALLKPFKKSYSFVKAKIGQSMEQRRIQRNVQSDIANRIQQGQISSLGDAEKQYAYGTKSYSYAVQLLRQKQLSQAREKAMFEAKKKIMIHNIKHPPKRTNIGSIPVADFMLGIQPKPTKKATKGLAEKQRENYKKQMDMIMRL